MSPFITSSTHCRCAYTISSETQLSYNRTRTLWRTNSVFMVVMPPSSFVKLWTVPSGVEPKDWDDCIGFGKIAPLSTSWSPATNLSLRLGFSYLPSLLFTSLIAGRSGSLFIFFLRFIYYFEREKERALTRGRRETLKQTHLMWGLISWPWDLDLSQNQVSDAYPTMPSRHPSGSLLINDFGISYIPM